MATPLDTIQEKRQLHSEQKAKADAKNQSKQDIDSLLHELKEVQLASLLGNKQKPSIILTDSSDLGEKFTELGDKFSAILEAIKADNTNVEGSAKLAKSISADFKALGQSLQKVSSTQFNKIEKALTALAKQEPVVIPAPIVTVNERPIDFSPIQRTIKEAFKAPVQEIDLNRFRAQDIDDASDDTQLIGFVDPSGKWYIVQNEVEKNTMRYVFGQGNYEEAWDNRYGHDYSVLSEAINAIRT